MAMLEIWAFAIGDYKYYQIVNQIIINIYYNQSLYQKLFYNKILQNSMHSELENHHQRVQQSIAIDNALEVMISDIVKSKDSNQLALQKSENEQSKQSNITSGCSLTFQNPPSYSVKYIKAGFRYTSSRILQDPQTNIMKRNPSTLQILGQKIKYYGDFIQAKHYFIQISNTFGLTVSRDAQKMVTVKKMNKQVMRNLIAMCLPFSSDKTVFQIQSHQKNDSNNWKVKVIQVSGQHKQFFLFCKKYIFQLWKNNLASVKPQQVADTVCLIYNHEIKAEIDYCQIAFNEIDLKKLDNAQQIELWHENFMKNIKKTEQKLKSIIEQNQNKCSSLEQHYFCLQKSIFSFFHVYNFYEQINSETNQQFQVRRQRIIKNCTLKQVLQFLQISLTSPLFKYNSKVLNIMSSECLSLPYRSSIQKLKNLSNKLSPIQNLKILRQFDCELSKSYFRYKQIPETQDKDQDTKQCDQQIFDMDTQLPLTIFCVLVLENSYLKTVISALSDYYQHEDDFGTQNRIMTAINAGFDFIKNEWEIPTGI